MLNLCSHTKKAIRKETFWTISNITAGNKDQIEEVRDLALPELFEGNSVTLIEWGDQIISALPKDHLEISFEYGEADGARVITISANGSSWNSRMPDLIQKLEIKGLSKC